MTVITHTHTMNSSTKVILNEHEKQKRIFKILHIKTDSFVPLKFE